jgi:hypothetical protein
MWLYNWQKIFDASRGSVTECYRIFDMIVRNRLPRNRYDPIYKYHGTNFAGQSFLKRPDLLLFNSYRYKRKDICTYLAVASQRSLAEYKFSGNLTLELIHSRLDPRDYLYDQTLIPVKNGIIQFPYEESGELKKWL